MSDLEDAGLEGVDLEVLVWISIWRLYCILPSNLPAPPSTCSHPARDHQAIKEILSNSSGLTIESWLRTESALDRRTRECAVKGLPGGR
jgi:hypothetical protein